MWELLFEARQRKAKSDPILGRIKAHALETPRIHLKSKRTVAGSEFGLWSKSSESRKIVSQSKADEEGIRSKNRSG